MNDLVIETHHLTKRFAAITAVSHLDLSVARGEIFGLVGPDGAGKTTTLRMLAAIMEPDGGTATVKGFDAVRQAEKIKPHIGYMAQGFALYGDLSVIENLAFFADIYDIRGATRQKRIDRLLQFARLDTFRDRRAQYLSGGMQKKLGLACTLIHEPEILYLDEPTTGVDPVSRREFWDILLHLHLQGVTILVSTPYMDEAERCSRVGLLYGGQLLVCDTPARVKTLTAGQLIELHPSDLRGAREIVTALPYVLEVQVYGRLLHVFVQDAARQGPLLQAALAAGGIGVDGLRAISPRMEEAFISLVAQQKRLPTSVPGPRRPMEESRP
jgi:ABC-2 type transport system ATP-binding protein